MLWLGIILCGVSVMCSFVALTGSPRFEKKSKDRLLVLLPSIVLFPVIPFFFLKRVVSEWPRLSIYSLAIIAAVTTAVWGAVILIPHIT